MAASGGRRLECERDCNQRPTRFWLSGSEYDCAFSLSSRDRARFVGSAAADGNRRRGHRLADWLQRHAGGGAGGISSASSAWLLAIPAATASRYSDCAPASACDFALGECARHRKLIWEI